MVKGFEELTVGSSGDTDYFDPESGSPTDVLNEARDLRGLLRTLADKRGWGVADSTLEKALEAISHLSSEELQKWKEGYFKHTAIPVGEVLSEEEERLAINFDGWEEVEQIVQLLRTGSEQRQEPNAAPGSVGSTQKRGSKRRKGTKKESHDSDVPKPVRRRVVRNGDGTVSTEDFDHDRGGYPSDLGPTVPSEILAVDNASGKPSQKQKSRPDDVDMVLEGIRKELAAGGGVPEAVITEARPADLSIEEAIALVRRQAAEGGAHDDYVRKLAEALKRGDAENDGAEVIVRRSASGSGLGSGSVEKMAGGVVDEIVGPESRFGRTLQWLGEKMPWGRKKVQPKRP